MRLINLKYSILRHLILREAATISIAAFTLVAGMCAGLDAAATAPAGPGATATGPGAPAVSAVAMGVSSGHDLDALWKSAAGNFDLSKHDAVLLLESARVEVFAGGAKKTTVHRVVWVGTDVGVDTHADLRVPWNSASSTFSVTKLRTWRDGRWWPDETRVSPTAVVETLPFAVALADDYSAMRETMLLHDGVEIPCIMETEYTIEETAPGPGGADGFFVLACREPAVLVEYVVEVPGGASFAFHSGNGAPAPAESFNTAGSGASETGGTAGSSDPGAAGNGGMKTYRWSIQKSGGLGFPQNGNPSSYAPYACWSTWKDWNTAGDHFASKFDEAAALEGALADTLATRLAFEPTGAAKAAKIASLVAEWTRPVRCDSRLRLFSPRPAARVYETAYGDALDRAVLAAALFRSAGLDARPVLRSAELGGVDAGAAGFTRFGEVFVCVTGDRFNAVYDPLESSLLTRPGMNWGRTVWKPGTGKAPQLRPDPEVAAGGSSLELLLTLEPAEDGWNGSGFYRAAGIFSPFVEMSGPGGGARAHIETLAGSVLGGASIADYNTGVLEETRVDAGFELSFKPPVPDGAGRTAIACGDPAGGIFSRLGADIRLSQERRTSPAVLQGRMTQRVQFRVKTGGRAIAGRPEPRSIENEAGSFSLKISSEDGWLTIDRTLTLNGGVVAPEAWPALRALLLEERDAAGRTVLLK